MALTKEQKHYQAHYYQTHKKEKKEYSRKYHQVHKEERKEHNRETTKKWRRKYRLKTGGKIYSVVKRDYPKDNKCELCKIKKILKYHHWDNDDLKEGKFVKGIWVCQICHFFLTFLEKHSNFQDYISKYFKLKDEISIQR